jgi:hypothetical protein
VPGAADWIPRVQLASCAEFDAGVFTSDLIDAVNDFDANAMVELAKTTK